MSQQQALDRDASYESYSPKTGNMALWVSLALGFGLIGAMGVAHWSSHSQAKAAKQAAAVVQAQPAKSSSVFQCADGRVSFTPCS